MENEEVWFMGPIEGPGFRLLVSKAPGVAKRSAAPISKPPDFPWKSMDRMWHFPNMPQGYTAMNWREDWSVLSVTDYTQDSRPNVLVCFAVHRENVNEEEMRKLAEERYPVIWKRLSVRAEFWSAEELRGR